MAAFNGSAGNDSLVGTALDDLFEGFAGADTFVGGAGSDTVTYQSSTTGLLVYLITGFAPATGDALGDRFESIENIRGTAFDDGIYGDDGDNRLWGGAGDDTLYGWGGINWLYGEDGHDNLVGGSGIDHIDGGSSPIGAKNGDHVSYQLSTAGIVVSLTDQAINTGDAAGDTFVDIEDVTGTNFADVIYGDADPTNNLWGLAGNDTIFGLDGVDVMIGDAGADYLDGGEGRDIADYETADAAVVASLIDPSINTGHAQGDVYVSIEDIAGSLYNDRLYGNHSMNIMLGWPGDDTMYGLDGDDNLEGMPGRDLMDGGAGIDTVAYTTAGTLNTKDWGNYTQLGVGVRVSLLDNSIGTNDAAGDSFISIENVQGSTFADFIEGDNANNVLMGIQGADTLHGAGGDDLLEGGLGADALLGGAGYDYASYSRAEAAVSVALDGSLLQWGDAQGDTFAGIEGILGSAFGDAIAGDGASNILKGEGGNDALFGRGGDDVLIGGAGGDQMDGGEGFDAISYQTSQTGLVISLQNAALNTGDAAGDSYGEIEAVYGSQYNDRIEGYAFAVSNLHGNGGEDTLIGGAAADILIGGAGADRLEGGAGLDLASYVTATAAVVVHMGSPSAGQGDGAGDVFVGIENLAGSRFGDILNGDAGDNVILGLEGNDSMFGGAGNDAFEGGDGADFMDGQDGLDVVSYENVTGPITVSLEQPAINTGAAAGDTFVRIENVIATSADDRVFGNAANNTLFGRLGNDSLYGGAGDDLLEGGAGADLLDGQTGYDYASYTSAATGVTVFMAGTHLNQGEAAGDTFVGLEGVVGSAFADLIGGDNASNTLQGMDGNDWLIGAGGEDLLAGGEGNDILFGGEGNDLLDGGNGFDVAFYRNATSGVTANLVDRSVNTGEAAGDGYVSVENLWGSDFGDTLTGDGADNQVYGFNGIDVLSGNGGNDAMYGGEGADTLDGGAGSDTFFFLLASEGNDTINGFQTGQDRLFFSQYWFGLPVGPAGSLSPSLLVTGANAQPTLAGPQFLYDQSTGVLRYDGDGTGAQAAIVMARLGAGTALTANDLWSA